MVLRVTSRWEAPDACDEQISHLLAIQNPDADLAGLRPESIPIDNFLLLRFFDVSDPLFPNGPRLHHLESLAHWLGEIEPPDLRGLVVHCDAGVSRSPALAWITLVLLDPDTAPDVHLDRVAEVVSSSYCWPNPLIVDLADEFLGTDGMLATTLHDWKDQLRS